MTQLWVTSHSRPRAPTSADHLSVPSGSAQSLGPTVAATFAAQSNYDQSVTNQAVVSNDYRSVTVHNGLTTQEADALVRHEVEQTQALANVAYEALSKEAQTMVNDLTKKLHEAVQKEEATRASAERQSRECSEREKELSAESSRMLRHVESEMQRAFDEAKTIREAGERKFHALVAESERRGKEYEEEARTHKRQFAEMEANFQAEKERIKQWCEEKIDEERRRAKFDADSGCSRLQEELTRVREEARRIQVDLNECRANEMASAERLHLDVSQRSAEEAQRKDALSREFQKLQSGAEESRRTISELRDRCAAMAKTLTAGKADNDELKAKLQTSARLPPMPRAGARSRENSPSFEALEQKMQSRIQSLEAKMNERFHASDHATRPALVGDNTTGSQRLRGLTEYSTAQAPRARPAQEQRSASPQSTASIALQPRRSEQQTRQPAAGR